jgi:antitoxin component YwqK of YwqJK toxin-antitoxin module
MATVSSVLRAASRNSLWVIAIWILSSCEDGPNAPMTYFDESKVNLKTKRGITYIETTPVTGVVFALNPIGDTLSVTPYHNGKFHGTTRVYHNNGKLRSLRHFENGWRIGEHAGWFENGNQQFLYHFDDDMFDGNQKEWMENGHLYSDLNYVKGREAGSQRYWYADGKIKTNYVIKDNRRYGLLGTKNCINATDSIFAQ